MVGTGAPTSRHKNAAIQANGLSDSLNGLVSLKRVVGVSLRHIGSDWGKFQDRPVSAINVKLRIVAFLGQILT